MAAVRDKPAIALPTESSDPRSFAGAHMIISKAEAEHYKWGDDCDGWILASGSDLLVIEEQMPAKTCEIRHYHAKSKQFFYVLTGNLTMEVDGALFDIPARSGIEIKPYTRHQARNDGDHPVMFLVISAPTTRGDRVEASTPNDD